MGLINRHRFISEYVRPYYRELYGKRPCTVFMDSKAIVVDKNLSVHEVSEVLLGADQRYLAEGFIVTDGGPTEEFLAARIENVMQFEKFKANAKKAFAGFPDFSAWMKPKT